MKTYEEIIKENQERMAFQKTFSNVMIGLTVFAVTVLGVICNREDKISQNNAKFFAGEPGFSYKNRGWWIKFREENDPEKYMNR